MSTNFLHLELIGNSSVRWLSAVGTFLGVLLVLLLVRRSLRGRLGQWIARFPGKFDDVLVETLVATHLWFLLAVALHLAAAVLELPAEVRIPIRLGILSLAFLQAGLWARTAVRRSVDLWSADRADSTGTQGTIGAAIKFVANLVIWSLVLLLVLQNLGVEVGALVAGLGVGGVAAALALQAVLGDLIASLSIYVDRPFDLGDFIVVGDFMGTVQQVGLRTTRLVALGGEHLVIPNGDLTSSRIRNYRRMEERRVVSELRLPFETETSALPEVVRAIEAVIRATEGVRFDRAHLRGFGQFAYEFEYVYYVLSADYSRFMDLQQAIGLEILRSVTKRGLKLAYPARTLHLPRA
jgi:small-conductance mechanosensitive channel